MSILSTCLIVSLTLAATATGLLSPLLFDEDEDDNDEDDSLSDDDEDNFLLLLFVVVVVVSSLLAAAATTAVVVVSFDLLSCEEVCDDVVVGVCFSSLLESLVDDDDAFDVVAFSFIMAAYSAD